MPQNHTFHLQNNLNNKVIQFLTVCALRHAVIQLTLPWLLIDLTFRTFFTHFNSRLLSCFFVSRFWYKRAGRGVFREMQELPPYLTETVPASPKRNPQLPKAEPINNSGSTSVTICLRRGKKHFAKQLEERNKSMGE